MKQYIIRRVLQMIPILIGVSILMFLIFSLAPGDTITAMKAVDPKMTKIQEQQLRHEWGLDQNIVIRYGKWAEKAITFNFGYSIVQREPVSQVIHDYIWNSFLLGITSFIAAFILAVPIGIVSATKQYSIFDKVFTILALGGMCVPAFFLGAVLIKIFACDLGWFPTQGMINIGSTATGMAHVMDVAKHMFLPFLVLTLMDMAGYMRYTRTSMLEVVRQDYIRTARSKGLSEKVVIYKHALRNALIPIVTIIGMSLPAVFSGAILTETLFSWPGIGKISYDAVLTRDYPFLMGFNMILAVLTLIGNLIADVTYALVDPRVRLS